MQRLIQRKVDDIQIWEGLLTTLNNYIRQKNLIHIGLTNRFDAYRNHHTRKPFGYFVLIENATETATQPVVAYVMAGARTQYIDARIFYQKRQTYIDLLRDSLQESSSNYNKSSHEVLKDIINQDFSYP